MNTNPAPTVFELAESIRRIARKMDTLLQHGDDRDGSLVDCCAHIDNLAEQIQNDLRRHLIFDGEI